MSCDSTARVFYTSTGECCRILDGHSKASSPWTGATFSMDGRRLLTAQKDGTLVMWRVCDGKRLLSLPVRGNVIWSVEFSPDGSRVLVASGSETLYLFDSETGECTSSLSGHEDWVRAACFSSNGQLVSS